MSAGTDKVSPGVHLSFLCPEIVEFCGRLGFEWVFLDAEHTPLTPHLARELVRAADVVKLRCVARVPEVKASIIEGFLDVGVLGIMAPNISSAEEAQSLVAAVKFAPQGQRGASGKSRAANYGLAGSPLDYYRQANQATFTVALIESQAGIDNLDAIIAVPGIDCIGIGPNDVGLSMGIETGMADPRVRSVVQSAQQRIKAHDKPQMAVVADAEQALAAAESGARLIAVPDMVLLATSARAILAATKGKAP